MSSKFETNFPLQHQQKDLRLAINMADSVDQPLHVGSAANEVHQSFSQIHQSHCSNLPAAQLGHQY